MEHKPLKRIIVNADTAILFIHGIVGTPNHFNDLIPLVPDDISIHNLLLHGHGKRAIDFSRTSMNKWVEQVTDAVDSLCATHDSVYIAAHSMGTLLAIEQAIRNNNIKGLFLLAVPIKVFPKPLMFRNVFKVYTGNIRADDKIGNAAKAACSIIPSKNPFVYLGWIARYLELFQKIFATRKLLSELKTPCIAFQSLLDEMVSESSAAYLSKHSSMEVIILKDSYHYWYCENDLQVILQKFQTFIEDIK